MKEPSVSGVSVYEIPQNTNLYNYDNKGQQKVQYKPQVKSATAIVTPPQRRNWITKNKPG